MSALLAAAARLLAPLLPYIIASALGFGAAEVYEHRAPWGLSHQVAHATADRDAWRQAQADTRKVALAWAGRSGAEAALRAKETATARKAVGELQAQCADRVARAQASARAIQAIITKELPHDAKGCPVRGLVDARELRDALQPGS